jgi:RHS repeat-associated protein
MLVRILLIFISAYISVIASATTQIRKDVSVHVVSSDSSISNKIGNNPKLLFDAWDYFGNVPINTSRIIRPGFASGLPVYTITFSAPGPISDPSFEFVSDDCTGKPIVGSECRYEVKFTASAPGTTEALFDWPANYCRTYAPFDCHVVVVNMHLIGESTDTPPEQECTECGSSIGVDSQTMIESIPLAGSDLRLYYSSAYSSSYISPYNTLGRKSAFNPNGMTLSNLHFYNKNERRLYLGTGHIVSVSSKSVVGPKERVVSADGSEVYEFTPGGVHIDTLYGLTGQVKYSFIYNASNKVSQITDAFGNITDFIYDVNADLQQIVAPFGQVNEITLTPGKLIRAVENPNGEKYEFTYKTGTNLMETYKKPGGQTSTFTYDTDGRLTKDLGNGGNYWELAKIASPTAPITVTSKMGRVKTVTVQTIDFDSYQRWEDLPTGAQKVFYQDFTTNQIEESFNGRVTTRASVNDERFDFLYQRPSLLKVKLDTVERSTSFGRTVSYGAGVTPALFNFDSITDSATTNGHTVTSVYDASTKTKTTTTAEGATTSLTIDSYERPVSFQVGTDTPWTRSYGSGGKLSSVGQGTHKTQTLTYNANGGVSQITNVRSEDTLFSYDLAGRVSQITLPDTRVINYSYDANGNLTGITPPGRPQHVFGFNSFEILGSYEPPSIGFGVTKNTTYTYNDDKQLTQISRPDGQNITFTYHATKGRLTSITTPVGNYNYHYNTVSQKLNKIESPYGIYDGFEYYGDIISSDAQKRTSDDLLFGMTSFTFDGSHRVSSRTIRGNASTPTSTINYSYNNDDKPTAVGDLNLSYSYPSGRLSGTSIDRFTDSYSYDSYGDLVGYSAVYTPPVGTPSTYYSYTLTRDNGGRISQKVETIAGVTSTYVYSYDSAGRLTLVKKNGTTTDSFTYDDNSNRISGVIAGNSFSATYDDQDRLLTLGARTYTYNNSGDLTRVQWTSTPSDKTDFIYDVAGSLQQATLSSGTVLDYVNDGLDRRAVKKAAGSFVFRYLYEDKYRISAIVNGSNAYVKEFIYATKVNVPDYMVTGGFKYKIITDHLGSPRLVVRADNGVVAQRMDYSTLGAVGNDTNPGFQPFGFAGGIYDPSTQLVRFGARDYDPRATGRWTTKDPIRFNGGDANLYGYVLNDPINFVDPIGTTWAGIGGGAAGGALGAIGAGCAIAFFAGTPIGQVSFLTYAIWGGLLGGMIGNQISGGF